MKPRAPPPARRGASAPPSVWGAWLVSVVATFLALGVPGVTFSVGYSALSSSLQTKVDVKAQVIQQAIVMSPEMWRFEEHRLEELLTRVPAELHDEQARIVTDGGGVIASWHPDPAPPTIVRSAGLYDAGRPVGRVEMQQTLRGLLLRSALSLLIGGLLAAGLVALVRRQQARERELLDAVFDESERARVTLQSIADAVITTDLHGHVDYLNPVAEHLTQWTLAEARGRPLEEVINLIDESTMTSVPSRIGMAIRDDQPCPFSGNEVALIRRDGSAVAIEESASPIHDRDGAAIGGVLVFHDVTTTRRMAQRITWAATHDALTGLVNRREFESRVEAALLGAHNSQRQHVLCYLDLDQFKVVNDTCGHAAGDALLKQLSAALHSRLRESDTLARLGGDEFGVLLEGCSVERAQVIAADLLAAVHEHRFQWDDKAFVVGVSIGLVAITAATASRAEVFSAADTACYTAKEQGRNRVCVFHSSDAGMARRRSDMDWSTRLTRALDEQRLVLHYQPYLALGAPAAAGQYIEILLRLIDEQGELVPPGAFLPAAERYNIMPLIDRWVVGTVFERYHDLQAQLGKPLTCAINLSGATLNAEGFPGFIEQQARLRQLPPGAICFEITETTAINNLRQATQFMRAVKQLGFRFALDDFGVGASSLGYLRSLPVDYLKIDGRFVRNIVDDPIDRAMAETINRVGHIMGLKTVGEYAESPGAVEALRALGVDFAQGFAVHSPLPLPPRKAQAPVADVPSRATALHER